MTKFPYFWRHCSSPVLQQPALMAQGAGFSGRRAQETPTMLAGARHYTAVSRMHRRRRKVLVDCQVTAPLGLSSHGTPSRTKKVCVCLRCDNLTDIPTKISPIYSTASCRNFAVARWRSSTTGHGTVCSAPFAKKMRAPKKARPLSDKRLDKTTYMTATRMANTAIPLTNQARSYLRSVAGAPRR